MIHDLIAPVAPKVVSINAYTLQEVLELSHSGNLPDELLISFLEQLPQETLRTIVQRVAGTDTSFIMTFTKQVKLVDAVLNSIVYPDGRLKPQSEDLDISLKDALRMSLEISKVMVRDLPKLYGMDRVQKLEQALADVMESEMTAEQRDKVLERLSEISK